MNTTERSFKTAELPSNQTQKSVLLKQHEKCCEEIMTLYDTTAARGNEVIQRLQQSEKHKGSIEEVEDSMKIVDERKYQWLAKWHEHKDRLEGSLQDTVINKEKIELLRDLGTIERELKTIENDYGDSIHSVTLVVEKCEDIMINFEPLEKRCKTFISSAHTCMQQRPSSAADYAKDIDEISSYLSTLHRQLIEKKKKLEIAVEVYETYELAVEWYNEGNKLLVEVAGDSQTITKSEEANQLLDQVAEFLQDGTKIQESRIEKINQLTKELYGGKPPLFVSELTFQNQEMLKAFNEINDEVFVLAEKLQESEYKDKQEKMQKFLMEVPDESSKHAVVQQEPVPEENLAPFETPSESTQSVREKLPAPHGIPVIEEQLQRKFIEDDKSTKEIKWPGKMADDLDVGITEITKTEVEFVPARVREELLEQATVQQPLESVQFETLFRPISMQDTRPTYEETIETSTSAVKPVLPYFPRVIRDVEATEGISTVFECIVKGEPEPDVIWLKDGIQIEDGQGVTMEFGDDDSCTLIFPSCQQNLAGTYTCKAFNDHGDATCSAILTVKDAMIKPEFIEAPTKQVVEEGSQASITVTVVGAPVPSVFWLKDGHNIDELREDQYSHVIDGDTHTLNISEVSVEDHSTVTCQAVNKAGVSKVDIQLEVKEILSAPVFIQELKSVSVDESSSHTFKCSVTGKPIPSVKWFKGDNLIKDSNKYTLDYTDGVATLTVHDVTMADSTMFTAEASNSEGLVSSRAHLGVTEIFSAPVFVTKLKNAVVEESSSHRFECFAIGKPTPTVKWFKDTKQIEESNNYKMVVIKGVASLIINEASIEDSTTFTAEASNTLGNVTTSGRLNVKEILRAPVFFEKPKDAVVDESTSHRFECFVTGKPTPTLRWYKKSELLRESHRYKMEYKDDIASLTIVDVTMDDCNTFTAEASNSQGIVKTSAVLEVKEMFSAPVFVTKLKNAEVEESSSHRFECSVIGKPTPTVKWFKDSKQIEESKNYKMVVIKGVASLIINEASIEDSVTFTAEASNTQGSVTTSGSLQVREILRAPVFFEKPKDAVVDESTSHRFECFVTGKPTPTLRWYKKSELLRESNKYKMEYKDDIASLTIVDVTMDDCTTFSAEASNSQGIVKTSAVLEVKAILSAPVFIEKLRDVEVNVSSTQRLECLVTGKPTPTVKWMKGDHLLEDSSKYKQDYSDGVASLIINDVSITDTAIFTAEASNFKGTVISSSHVKVTEPKKHVPAPRFSLPLSNVDVDEGVPCKLSCFVITESKPTINWFKDHKPIDDSGDFELTYEQGMCCLFIRETFTEDTGHYSCKVTNEGGEAKTSAYLTVEALPEDDSSAPHFVTKLSDVKMSSGERLELTCRVFGNPEPMVTWFHNGNQVEESENIKIIEDEEKHMLVIREVSPDHSGTYVARASNHVGEDTTVSNIIVEQLHTSTSGIVIEPRPKPAAPTVLEQPPKSVQVVEGESITINVHITGFPTPKVFWYKDEVIVEETEEIRIVEDKHRCSLVFSPARHYHSGLYLYKAANTHGALTGTCRIHIEDHTTTSVTYPKGPTFIQPLMESVSPVAGDTIRIQCRIKSLTQPQIRWTKNSRTITETSRVRVTQEEDMYCLIIIHVKPTDAGIYKIAATTPLGQIESSTVIDVKEPQIVAPMFSILLRDLHVTEGDEVRFDCQVEGQPIPDVTWYKRDEIIEDDSDFKIIVNEDRHSLLIKEVFSDDSGLYKVVASNTAGQATSQAELIVECAPHVMRNLVDVEVREGESTQFECIISGNPSPSITWLLNENPVLHDFIAESDGERHRLVIPEVFSDDDGLYTCIAENYLGQASTQAYLKVKEEIRKEIECETIERTESKTVSHTRVSLENSMPAQEPPQFSQSLKSINTTEGQPVAFEAHVTGDPEPTVTWFRDNIDVSKCPDYDITIKDGVCCLKIEEAFPEDAGKFKVVAENAIGKASSTANLLVEGLLKDALHAI
ncbi:muscle M-line assembly protein unc-89-like [Anneissia japonica]|uniref:muscle M-line assembly protein unc-89-like n=1 Tax=Anneissia japonica TaxID=1529436 RepID=UPI00142561EB|nr:muscle M-line assembly protein unc-89-like [Anneissia japonica]